MSGMYDVVYISEEDTLWFKQFYKEHDVIGFMKAGNDSRVLLKSKPGCRAWTPSFTARDCGDHYILAQYSSYDYVDKIDGSVIKDVGYDR